MEQRHLDRLAYAGVELPDGLDAADTLYFLMLRAACFLMRQTDIDPEQARREKQRIDDAVKSYRADRALAKRHADVMLVTGQARAEYRKAHNAGDTAAMVAAAGRIVTALDNMEL